MSVVISIRIPKDLKERMDRIRGVNWSELIRKFIEDKVVQYEIEMILKRVDDHLRDVPELPQGTIARWLEIDRESH